MMLPNCYHAVLTIYYIIPTETTDMCIQKNTRNELMLSYRWRRLNRNLASLGNRGTRSLSSVALQTNSDTNKLAYSSSTMLTSLQNLQLQHKDLSLV